MRFTEYGRACDERPAMSAGNAGAPTPFPFSVGFPLSIRPGFNCVSICGVNRGLGWPILCEVPTGAHATTDAKAIFDACTEKVDRWLEVADSRAVNERPALLARVAELEAACRDALGELDRQAKAHRETGWTLSAGCCEESARVVRAALTKKENT